jgi:hypothetical protein
VILPRTNGADERATRSRDAARAKLLAAGFLATDIRAPEGMVPLSDEDLAHLGQRPTGARPSEGLIDEDRGIYSARNLLAAATAMGLLTDDPLMHP